MLQKWQKNARKAFTLVGRTGRLWAVVRMWKQVRTGLSSGKQGFWCVTGLSVAGIEFGGFVRDRHKR
jgi:hypothetical protein